MISKSFSLKRLLIRIGFLIPVLAFCVYFFNNEIIAKPVIEVSNDNETTEIKKRVQDQEIISIRLEGDKILVNGKNVDLMKFAEHLDALMENKSDQEIRDMNFHMQTKNAEEGLLDLLNTEFEKTRFSSVTGHSVLPPPPPVPAKQTDIPPPPPVPHNAHDVPPPPPAPAPRIEEKKHDSLRRLHMNERARVQEQMRMEREFYKNEMERERVAHMELRKEQIDSLRKHRETALVQQLEEKRARTSEQREQIRKKHEEIRAENRRLKEEHREWMAEERKKDSIR